MEEAAGGGWVRAQDVLELLALSDLLSKPGAVIEIPDSITPADVRAVLDMPPGRIERLPRPAYQFVRGLGAKDLQRGVDQAVAEGWHFIPPIAIAGGGTGEGIELVATMGRTPVAGGG